MKNKEENPKNQKKIGAKMNKNKDSQKNNNKSEKLNIHNSEEFAKKGVSIDTNYAVYKSEFVTTCPLCGNFNELKDKRTLFVEPNLGIWHCDYCGWGGKLKYIPLKPLNTMTCIDDIEKMTKRNKDGNDFWIYIGTSEVDDSYLYLNEDILGKFGYKTATLMAELVQRYEYRVRFEDAKTGSYFPYPIGELEKNTTLDLVAQKTCIKDLIQGGYLMEKSSEKFNQRYFRIIEKDHADDAGYIAIRKLFIEGLYLEFAVCYAALISMMKNMMDCDILDEDGYFPFSHEEIQKQTGLNTPDLDYILDDLEESEIISMSENRDLLKFNFNNEKLKKFAGVRLINGRACRVPHRVKWE